MVGGGLWQLFSVNLDLIVVARGGQTNVPTEGMREADSASAVRTAVFRKRKSRTVSVNAKPCKAKARTLQPRSAHAA